MILKRLLAALLVLALPGAALAQVSYGSPTVFIGADGQKHLVKPSDPLPTFSPGGGGGGPVTIADGADIALGSRGDAAWSTGPGTLVGILKRLDADINANSGDGADATQGSKADPYSISTDTTPASLVALQKGQINRLQAILTALGSPEQAGVAKPVTAAALPLPAGASTAAAQASLLTALGAPEQAGATKPISSIPASTTDRSLTITTGGTAQQLMAANAARRAFYLFSANASGTCWASFTATAAANGQGSFPVPALGGFGMEMNAPSLALSVLCPTTGMVLTAWESQ